MPRYAHVENGAIVWERSYPDPIHPTIRATKNIHEIFVTDPPFDAAMQVRTGPVETIQADRIDRVFTVRDKTAQELQDEEDNAVLDGVAISVLTSALYAAERAGDDITDPVIRQAIIDRTKEIYRFLRQNDIP